MPSVDSVGHAVLSETCDALSGIATLSIAAPSDGRSAYAIAAGLPPDAMAGSEFLVDPDGWLRAAFRSAKLGEWLDPAVFLAAQHQATDNPSAQGGIP